MRFRCFGWGAEAPDAEPFAGVGGWLAGFERPGPRQIMAVEELVSPETTPIRPRSER